MVEEPIGSIVKESIDRKSKCIKLTTLGGNQRSIFGAFVFCTKVQTILSGIFAVALAIQIHYSNINHAVQVSTPEFSHKKICLWSLLRGKGCRRARGESQRGGNRRGHWSSRRDQEGFTVTGKFGLLSQIHEAILS